MELKRQQTLSIGQEPDRKVHLHKVGYNGYSKRLTMPGHWCVFNEVDPYDHLVIIERKRSLEIMTETEFLRLYPELDGCDKQVDHSSVRW